MRTKGYTINHKTVLKLMKTLHLRGKQSINGKNDGFTRMGIANRSQYFLIIPEPKSTDEAYFNGIDYPSFFKEISDDDFWNASVYLNKRDYQKAFTTTLLIKKLGINAEKSEEILSKLNKYKMVYSTKN